MTTQKLVWDEKYSVKVKLIDDQHKTMFETINTLIDALSGPVEKEQIDNIISSLIEYKQRHFATEEAYFNTFHYEGAADHILKHNEFGEKLEILKKESNGDTLVLAFKLVDFLEDWLINHLMVTDQKYVDCFQKNGLS